MQSKIVGFILVCLAVPAVYAGGLGWYAATFGPAAKGVLKPDAPSVLALLGGLPLFVSSLGKWWDVWIKQPPKLGNHRPAVSPADYSFGVVRNHVVVACACVVVHLAYNQSAIEDVDHRVGELPAAIESTKAEISKTETAIANQGAMLARLEAAPRRPIAFGETYNEYLPEQKRLDDRLESERTTLENMKYQKEELARLLGEQQAELGSTTVKSAANDDEAVSYVYLILMASIFITSLSQPKATRMREGQALTTGAAS